MCQEKNIFFCILKVTAERSRSGSISQRQGCGSVFIFSGSGSRVWCWRPIRIRIRIQYGSRALMTKNWKKITAEIFFFFWSKTAIYLSLGLHKVCPSYRRSLQLSKESIQHFKTWTFTNIFLLLWVIFALLDPDPVSEYGSGSGSTDPIEYGSGSRIRIHNPGQRCGSAPKCHGSPNTGCSLQYSTRYLLP